jgi:hypothetical protein
MYIARKSEFLARYRKATDVISMVNTCSRGPVHEKIAGQRGGMKARPIRSACLVEVHL